MSVRASDIDYLPVKPSYDASVPTPAQTLGYEPGVWHVRHDQLVAYMRALATASNRIELSEIGTTYEDRALLQLTISSPENLEHVDTIKAAHRRLASPDGSSVDTRDLPVMVSLNYSIHGNEPSGSNAALLIAYYLAAAQGDAIESLLNDTVIVLNPALNPDGLSLFTTWVNHHKSKNLVRHPLSREHTTVWPAGRMNHYLFNLNRDWLFLQQRETQLFVEQFQSWLPQVIADFHETGTDTTAYFQPGVPDRIHPLTTAENQALTAQLAEFSAAAYDEHGLLYYTRERFDDFYHGKSSTYADVIGSIGLTFEVGSSRGHLKTSINGDVSFPLTIKKQIIASLSVLAGAQQLRQELLNYQARYFETARAEAARDRTEIFVVGDDGDPGRLREFSRLLLRQGIALFDVSRGVEIDGVVYGPGEAVAVPVRQTSYRLIQSLFERRTEFDEPVFYDVSSWNAPMAFNLPVAELASNRGIVGEELALPLLPQPSSTVPHSKIAYAFSWRGLSAPKLLAKLLEEGIHARVAKKPLSLTTHSGVRTFERGSIVIPVQPQEDRDKPLRETVQHIAIEVGMEVFAVNSGLANAGIDLGSNNLKPVNPVRPILIGGDGISRSEVGEIWFLLDQRLDMSLPIVDIAKFSQVDLSEFTHLILVNGDYDTLIKHVASIQDWVRAGGTLVAQRDAAVWVNENFHDETKMMSESITDNETEDPGESAEPAAIDDVSPSRPYALQEIDTRREKITGAILHVEIDETHPIGFGYDEDGVSVMRQGTQVLPILANPYSHPGRYSDSPLLSGYVSAGNLKQLRGTPAVTAEKVGDGLIVTFADNPNFRAYFVGSSKLFINALFFSQTVSYVD